MSKPTTRIERRSLLLGGAAAGLAAGCRTTGAAAETPRATEEQAALFPELEDARPRYRPIGAEERSARRARLGRILEDAGIDAFVCEGGATLTHLAGVSWGRSERLFALVVLKDSSHFWLCPAFEQGKAELSIQAERGPGGAIVAWQEHEYAFAPLVRALRERGAERVAFDPGTRLFAAEGLRAELGAERVVSGARVVLALRGRKDEHELELLRAANELTQQALVAAAERLRPGLSGGDVSELVHAAQRRLGLQRTWALCLVGPAAAYPHGTSDETRLAPGDFVLVDTGGSFHDYQSDITRTWSVGGPPSARAEGIWRAVRDAQQQAFEAIRPGVACSAIDGIARAAIERAGFGSGYEHFTHRLGHGIGLEGHEDPYFDGGSAVLLEPGMTLSDEPGLYFPGELGVRIEDIVCVTATGADHFGSWQAGPESPG
jgi:Xaa-Pro dipeptidase